MATRKLSGVTFECVSCKAKRLLNFDEIRTLEDLPSCDKCGMPMVAAEAAVRFDR